MFISSNYVVVERVEEPKAEGFQAVELQDSFVYKGKVVQVSSSIVFIDNHEVKKGDVILFSKYSPDTMDIEEEGKKLKFIKVSDILAVV